MLDWCDEPCTLQKRVTGDTWGEATWGPLVKDECRFEHKSLLVSTVNGDSVMADGIVYIPNARAWSLQDRFNYEGSAFEIIRRRVYRDMDGPQYQSFMVQKKA